MAGGAVAIVGGRVVPITGPPIEQGTVHIENGRISAVGDSVDVPEGAQVVDAGGVHSSNSDELGHDGRAMSDSFSSQLWNGITDVYEAILAHPFLAGMTDGSLPADAFTFYVVQDALYLRRYAQALAAVATHAPDPAQTEMFARHAAGIVAVEMSLHDTLLGDLDIDPADVDDAEEAPTTLAYNSYLLANTQGGSYAEGVGTVLPCYWIYGEVGKHLLGRGSPNPRYQKWIDTYGGDEFDAEVRDVIEVTDKLGPELSASERRLVHQHFRTTSRYEWMFWDMGYRQEAWPV